jgi:hypothetical protein
VLAEALTGTVGSKCHLEVFRYPQWLSPVIQAFIRRH